MRRLLVVALLLAAAAAPGSSSAATRAQPTRLDWELYVLQAGPHGASDVRITNSFNARATAAHVVFGWLESLYDPTNQRQPFISCGFAHEGHGYSRGEVWGHYYLNGPIKHMDPGERLASLWFFDGGVLAQPRFGAVAKSGKVIVEHAVGDGASSIEFATLPTTRQDAVRTTATGLAGAFVSPNLSAAGLAAWTAPDGSSGSFIDGGLPVRGCNLDADPTFAGGPGRWQWSWTAIGHSPTGHGLLGWAPIGRYWPVFRAGPVSPTDVGLASQVSVSTPAPLPELGVKLR